MSRSSAPDLLGALALNEAAAAAWDEIGAEGQQTYIAWVDRARTRRGRAKRVVLAVARLADDPYSSGSMPFGGGPGDGYGAM